MRIAGLLFSVLAACSPTQPRESEPAPVDPETLMSVPDQAPAKAPAKALPARPPPARGPVALPDPLPGERSDVTALVGGTLRAVAGDFDGDRALELAVVDGSRLRVIEPSGRVLAETSIPGGIRVLEAIPAPAGQGTVIAAGWGDTVQHRHTPARVNLYRLQDGRLVEDVVATPTTTRNDVLAILSQGAPLLVAYFESKYMVHAARAQRAASGWSLHDLATIRMATSWAHGDVDGDGQNDLVVGRVYGDDTGVDGDAFLLRPSGQRVPIPTTRGVRGLAVVDTDGDGKAEVFLGDGWHQAYAAQARGLLTRATWDGRSFRSELVEETAGQFAIFRILPADVDGDGRPEIVTQGDQVVRVFKRQGDRWKGLTVAAADRDLLAANLDGRPGDELLVIGERSERISLRSARW